MDQDEQTIVNNRLVKAAFENDFSLIKSLLTSRAFEPNAQINVLTGFIGVVCLSGNMKTLQYILASPELAEHADISHDNQLALRNSLWAGNTKMVDYLLTSPRLKRHANLYQKDSNAKEVVFNFLRQIHHRMYNDKNELFIDVIDYLTGDYAFKKKDTKIYSKINQLFLGYVNIQKKIKENILSNFLKSDDEQKEKMKELMINYHPQEHEKYINHKTLEQGLMIKKDNPFKKKL